MIGLAVSYLVGVILGLFTGWALPWYASGCTGWLLFACAFLYGEHVDQSDDHDWRRERVVAVGASFGAWAGAAAAEVPEMLGVLAWPGHESDGAFVALLVAASWLMGCIVAREGEAESPVRDGLSLYLLTIVLAYGPPLWEVMPW